MSIHSSIPLFTSIVLTTEVVPTQVIKLTKSIPHIPPITIHRKRNNEGNQSQTTKIAAEPPGFRCKALNKSPKHREFETKVKINDPHPRYNESKRRHTSQRKERRTRQQRGET